MGLDAVVVLLVTGACVTGVVAAGAEKTVDGAAGFGCSGFEVVSSLEGW